MSYSDEPKSGFHKFIQYVNLPIGLINLLLSLGVSLKVKYLFVGTNEENMLYISIAFIIAVTILNVITEVGFTFYMGFSYYTIILYNIMIVVNNAVMYDLMKKAGESELVLLSTRGTLTGTIIMMLIVIVYYSTHRNLFTFNEREEKPKKEKKKKNDPWADTERYVPEPVVRMSKREEASIANRRLTGMINNDEDNDKSYQDEPDIFDGLK